MTNETPAPIGHNRPPKPAKVFFHAVCPECSTRFGATHHAQAFCTPAHKTAYNNRILGEGQRIVGMAKAWRAGRSVQDPVLRQAAKEAFSLMCRELDALNATDKAAGRVPALKVFWRRLKTGMLDFQGAINRR